MSLKGRSCFPTIPNLAWNKNRGEVSSPPTDAILAGTCDATRTRGHSRLAGKRQLEARRAKPERRVWSRSQRNYNPSLLCVCDSRPRVREERVWVRTINPSTPRHVSRFLSKHGGKEGQGWRPTEVRSPKGGKGELHLPTGSAALRLRPETCRHLAPSEALQTNPIPGVP